MLVLEVVREEGVVVVVLGVETGVTVGSASVMVAVASTRVVELRMGIGEPLIGATMMLAGVTRVSVTGMVALMVVVTLAMVIGVPLMALTTGTVCVIGTVTLSVVVTLLIGKGEPLMPTGMDCVTGIVTAIMTVELALGSGDPLIGPTPKPDVVALAMGIGPALTLEGTD